MHLPDGYLSASCCGVTWAAAAAGVGFAAYALWRPERASSGSRRGLVVPGTIVEKTAGAAAVVFAAQMVNFPILPGVSGHLVGGALAAALVGWAPAVLALATVLVLQAALFGDGGAAALGANLLNMALLAPLAAEGVLQAFARQWDAARTASTRAEDAAAEPLPATVGAVWTGAAALVGTLAAAVACGTELALSGVGDSAAVFGKVLLIHLPIAAAEGLLSALAVGAVLTLLARAHRERSEGALAAAEPTPSAPAARPIPAESQPAFAGPTLWWAAGIAAATAILLAPLASSLPDGLEAAAAVLGFASRAAEPSWAWLPDYAFPCGTPSWYETAAIGLLGAAAAGFSAALFALSISLAGRSVPAADRTPA